jgi:hypothetical protein
MRDGAKWHVFIAFTIVAFFDSDIYRSESVDIEHSR